MPLFQNTKTNSREPKFVQSHSSKESKDPVATVRVPVVGQKEDVEEEILRNIDVEVLDALSPQPSIVSVLTHGLERVRTPVNSIAARGMHTEPAGRLMRVMV